MQEFFKEILSSDGGSFGFIASIIVVIAWVSMKVGSFKAKVTGIDKMQDNINTIKGDMQFLKNTVIAIRQSNSPLAQTNSPINLSPKGKEVAQELNVEESINKQWAKIKEDIKDKVGKETNLYNIQVACFEIGSNFSLYLGEYDFDKVKTFAYKEGLNLYDFDVMFGIIIRNRYFKEMGLEVSDVDKHEPKESDS